jgi:hypothetical protein
MPPSAPVPASCYRHTREPYTSTCLQTAPCGDMIWHRRQIAHSTLDAHLPVPRSITHLQQQGHQTLPAQPRRLAALCSCVAQTAMVGIQTRQTWASVQWATHGMGAAAAAAAVQRQWTQAVGITGHRHECQHPDNRCCLITYSGASVHKLVCLLLKALLAARCAGMHAGLIAGGSSHRAPCSAELQCST